MTKSITGFSAGPVPDPSRAVFKVVSPHRFAGRRQGGVEAMFHSQSRLILRTSTSWENNPRPGCTHYPS
jgi:hypothetical protein